MIFLPIKFIMLSQPPVTPLLYRPHSIPSGSQPLSTNERVLRSADHCARSFPPLGLQGHPEVADLTNPSRMTAFLHSPCDSQKTRAAALDLLSDVMSGRVPCPAFVRVVQVSGTKNFIPLRCLDELFWLTLHFLASRGLCQPSRGGDAPHGAPLCRRPTVGL